MEPKIFQNKSFLLEPKIMVREMIHDLWNCRHLGWTLAVRDIKAKYRSAWLGLAWAFLPPIATTLVFVVLQNQQMLKSEGMEVPYPIYTMVSIVLWQLFSESVVAPLQVVNGSRSLLSKILFPREALIVSAVVQVCFNFIIKLFLLFFVFAWWGILPTNGIIWLPLVLLALLALGILFGVLIVPIGVFYQDVIFSLSTVLMLLMFLTPVGYSIPSEGLLNEITQWNPMAILIQCGRELIFTGQSNAFIPMLAVGLITGFGLALGWVLYRATFPIAVERFSS
ncbi:MAG: polysialic acid transporter [Euryarchaeota archaeon]|nr:polysialic acid transporter [Euryarchaeota archaeon]|tara:strand:+ start:2575 stop:3417 length:843 start_codon:yes stop_codon:yes gene_type:complete